MERDAPVIYGLEFPARALANQRAEAEVTRFLVGTLTLRAENELHMVEFNDEDSSIACQVFSHAAGEVWKISASPAHSDVIATCYVDARSGATCVSASVWRMPSASVRPGAQKQPLEQLCSLDGHSGDVRSVLWHPAGESSRIASIDDSNIRVWDIGTGLKEAKPLSTVSLDAAQQQQQQRLAGGAWSPHQGGSQIAAAAGTDIVGFDLRSGKKSYTIEKADATMVRDIDFNPNKQHTLVSGGDDCRIRFWDVRNPRDPLKLVTHHSHWVWGVRYNHFHDQLVLSASSDGRVILSSILSLSSDPYGHSADDKTASDKEAAAAQDRLLARYDEHEDSVYAAEWSNGDPWTFASLSHDGRLVINRVPREEKYKILL
eukprot:Opistho-2@80492